MNTILLLILCSLSLALCAAPTLTKLGSFNYQVDETSPLYFGGRILMMETMPTNNPQHKLNCSCYFTIRDLLTWNIIVSLPQSCDHGFGSAIVYKDPTNGKETIMIFGTRWIRVDVDHPGAPQWDGPCSLGSCAIDVYWSSDPKLQVWQNDTAAVLPKGMVAYNTDAAPVDPTALAKHNSALPPHKWIMALEYLYNGFSSIFLINNEDVPTKAQWTLLDPSKYFIPKLAGGSNGVGACPTIRYVPTTGYYYVISGGNNVYITRSKDLINWELGHYNGGTVLSPSPAEDCKVMSRDWTAWNPSDATRTLLVQKCNTWDKDADDADLTEIQYNGKVATLLMWDSTNQASIGFSELGLYEGPMADYFAANYA